MSAMVTPRQLQIPKCGYETSVNTGNYVTIFAHLNHIPELSPQHTSIYVQQHTYIYLYGSQSTAVSTVTRHWAGQPRIKVQCLAGA